MPHIELHAPLCRASACGLTTRYFRWPAPLLIPFLFPSPRYMGTDPTSTGSQLSFNMGNNTHCPTQTNVGVRAHHLQSRTASPLTRLSPTS